MAGWGWFLLFINMANEIIYLTAEGMQKLKDELDHMRSVERPAISAAIAEARDKGDLSENAEYDAARDGGKLHSLAGDNHRPDVCLPAA